MSANWLQSGMQLWLSRHGNRIADAGVVSDEALAAIYRVKGFVPSLTLVKIGRCCRNRSRALPRCTEQVLSAAILHNRPAVLLQRDASVRAKV